MAERFPKKILADSAERAKDAVNIAWAFVYSRFLSGKYAVENSALGIQGIGKKGGRKRKTSVRQRPI